MSSSLHTVPANLPGYGSSGKGCLPYFGVSGRAVGFSPCPSLSDCRTHSKVMIITLRCPLKKAPIMCKAGSGGSRLNPDFSRKSKHDFSRHRNTQNKDRDSDIENLEESEFLSSKNGGVLSVPKNESTLQSSAGPGPREREIVELFRKVQAKLRERPGAKEEKEESPEGQRQESEAVDSLLKLLKKHSAETGKGKAKSGGDRPGEVGADRQGQSPPRGQDKSKGFLSADRIIHDDKIFIPKRSRPPSTFTRRSPVRRVKLEPVSNRKPAYPPSGAAVYRKSLKNQPEMDPEREEENGSPVETELDQVTEIDTFSPEDNLSREVLGQASLDEEFDDNDDAEDLEEEEEEEGEKEEEKVERQISCAEVDLDAMKVPELRELAKSRGIKGYSKLKKSDLIEMLSDDRIQY